MLLEVVAVLCMCVHVCSYRKGGVALHYRVSVLIFQTQDAVSHCLSLGSVVLSMSLPALSLGISMLLMKIHHSISKMSPRLPSVLLRGCYYLKSSFSWLLKYPGSLLSLGSWLTLARYPTSGSSATPACWDHLTYCLTLWKQPDFTVKVSPQIPSHSVPMPGRTKCLAGPFVLSAWIVTVVCLPQPWLNLWC